MDEQNLSQQNLEDSFNKLPGVTRQRMRFRSPNEYLQYLSNLYALQQQLNPPKAPGIGTQLGGMIGGAAAGGLGAWLGNSYIPGMLSGASATPAATATGGASGVGAVGGMGGSTGASVASGGVSASAPASSAATGGIGGMAGMGAAGLGALAGVGAGTYLGGQAAYDMYRGKEPGLAGRATLGIATGGLSELAKPLFGKSTEDYQKERWGGLSPALQGLYQANHPDNSDGKWTEGKYAGQEWSFDKASDLAKQDPTHFIGVLGNAQAFGDKWLSTDPNKQKQIVAELLNQGLYNSDKGDVLISDPNKANEIYNSIVNSNNSAAKKLAQGLM